MDYLRLLRPSSLIKNVFVFVPLFFAGDMFDWQRTIPAAWAAAAFCLVASAVYVLNDLIDQEEDRRHPIKQLRPLAAGKVSVPAALLLPMACLAASALLVRSFVPAVLWPLVTYFALNLSYSFLLKRVAIADILLVSGFYLIRVMAGGMAAQVPVSPWLLLCTIFISLFLVVGKRRAEFGQEERRHVLRFYTGTFLDALMIISVSLTLISYSLYTVLVLGTDLAVCSIFLVLLAMLRYLLLVYTTDHAECPEKAVWVDPVALVATSAWLVVMYVVFYVK